MSEKSQDVNKFEDKTIKSLLLEQRERNLGRWKLYTLLDSFERQGLSQCFGLGVYAGEVAKHIWDINEVISDALTKNYDLDASEAKSECSFLRELNRFQKGRIEGLYPLSLATYEYPGCRFGRGDAPTFRMAYYLFHSPSSKGIVGKIAYANRFIYSGPSSSMLIVDNDSIQSANILSHILSDMPPEYLPTISDSKEDMHFLQQLLESLSDNSIMSERSSDRKRLLEHVRWNARMDYRRKTIIDLL